ncbi:PilZ domain-containing protein [Virgibacillus sp. C22-A2]|uniref:PilZ domain-containing protein n=1 Tax=Virgibacillus tibetensis TaxID=3042313 RepID=A0ABU6KFX9_9BACI|nr:PilZ domain-containing protein [Virgibacillus sp. C22-A2]
MRYNREEPFRYTFGQPVPAYFRISNIGGRGVSTAEGEAVIIDISPSGARIHTDLNIPFTKENTVDIVLRFELSDKELIQAGGIVWKNYKNEYGIDFFTEDIDEKQLIEQLKLYTKNAMHIENDNK